MKNFAQFILASSLIFQPFCLHAAEPYAGIEGGVQGHVKHQNARLISHYKNSSGWATRIFSGALWENSYHFKHGVEVGLSQYKTITNSLHLPQNTQTIRSDLSRKALDVMGVIDYQFANKINLFGKAGTAYVKQRTQTSSERFVADPIAAQQADLDMVKEEKFSAIKRNRYMAKAALGIGYEVAPKQTMDINYSYVFGKRRGPLFATSKKYSEVMAVDSFMLAWNYHFS